MIHIQGQRNHHRVPHLGPIEIRTLTETIHHLREATIPETTALPAAVTARPAGVTLTGAVLVAEAKAVSPEDPAAGEEEAPHQGVQEVLSASSFTF